MKKTVFNFTLLLIVVVFTTNSINAQVGINTDLPRETLEIYEPVRSFVQVSSDGFIADTVGINFSNRNAVDAGVDYTIQAINSKGLYFQTSSSILNRTYPHLLFLDPEGRIGMGTDEPTRFLDVHVNGTANIRFNSLIGNSVSLELQRTGAPTDWRITNSSTWLDFVTSNDDFSSTNIRFAFHRDGRLGINTDTPVQPLDVNGIIRSRVLAGTGIRNVGADASGNLVINASFAQILSLSPIAFTSNENTASISPMFLSRQASENTGTNTFYAPVHLPNGATITSFEVYYLDNSSTHDLSVGLHYKAHNADSYTPQVSLNTNSKSAENRNLASTNIPFGAIDNEANAYWVSLESDGWNYDTMRVTSVVIGYIMP